MENALYYTFSTIAQTLAAAIALLAAFVLYRLQILSIALDKHANVIREQYYEDFDKAWMNSFIVKEEYQKLLDYTVKYPIDIGTDEQDSYVKDSLDQIKYFLPFKRSLLNHFYVALILTVGLILSSVVLLSITPSVNANENVRTWSLIIGIAWLVTCFTSYVMLLRKSLSSRIG
jgi:glycerol uptake facilitator-like aquaporin